MTSLAIVDTGPLLASVNRADPDHQASLAVLSSPQFDLVLPALCVAEVCYFLASRVGWQMEARFLRGLAAFDVRAPETEDWSRISDLVSQYSELGLGGTDASVVALAERLGAEVILTLDRRHFSVVRPRHCERFRLLPEA